MSAKKMSAKKMSAKLIFFTNQKRNFHKVEGFPPEIKTACYRKNLNFPGKDCCNSDHSTLE